MKLIITTILFLFSSLAIAQNYQGMSEKDMQRMQQQALKMQACMNNVDKAKIEAMGDEAKQVEAEIKNLCAQGKRSQAEKKAYSYSREMNTNPDVIEMRKCNKMMQGMMPKMPTMGFADEASKDSDERDSHICDEM